MKRFSRKCLCAFLAVVMILSAIPFTVMATTQDSVCSPLFISVGLAPDEETDGSGENHLKNGMCYIFRLEDGSFVIYDGGNKEEINDMADKIMATLRANAVTDKIVISAWVITHPHIDHVGGFCNFVNKYADKVSVERVLHDLPDMDDTNESTWISSESAKKNITSTKAAIATLKSKNPDMQELDASDIRNSSTPYVTLTNSAKIEILYTFDMLGETYDSTYGGENATSIVSRMNVGGWTFLMTGDMTEAAAKKLVDTYDDELKSDVVQVAHHGFSDGSMSGSDSLTKGVGLLYTKSAAKLAIWPAAKRGYDEMNNATGEHVRNSYFYDTTAGKSWHEYEPPKMIVAFDNITTCSLPATKTSFTVVSEILPSEYEDFKKTWLYENAQAGTEEHPYLISSAEEFLAINDMADTTGVYFRQTANIDFTGYTNPSITKTFKGVYDGAGYTISNFSMTTDLQISGNYCAGLFPHLSGDAIIKNVNLENATINITANTGYTGGIAGYVSGDAQVFACSVSGTITGTANVGGIVGGLNNNGAVRYCINNATVVATGYTSGNCFVGGIIGRAFEANNEVLFCANNGDISLAVGNSKVEGVIAAGGIAGMPIGAVTNCYNTGDVTATNNVNTKATCVGGIVGRIRNTACTVTNCYSTAQNVSADSTSGASVFDGLILGVTTGTTGTLKNCYAVAIEGVDISDQSNESYAALTKATECGTKTAAEIKAFTDAIDAEIASNMSGEVFQDGSQENPYLIDSVEDFAKIDKYNGADGLYFRQTADIDFAGTNPMLVNTFKGIYDGRGYKLSSYRIETETNSAAGLFNNISGATIKNVNIVGATIYVTTPSNGNDGALVGKATNSLISACTVDDTSSVRGTDGVGGIVGYLADGSTIEYCTNRAKVNGFHAKTNASAGGIVGWTGATETNGKYTIKYCVNYGQVFAKATQTDVESILNAGGIIGYANGGTTVDNCVNYGTIMIAAKNGKKPRLCCGGVVGRFRNGTKAGTLTNSYNLGNVLISDEHTAASTECVNLVIGWSNGVTVTMKNCYSVAYNDMAVYSTTDGGTGTCTINATNCEIKTADEIKVYTDVIDATIAENTAVPETDEDTEIIQDGTEEHPYLISSAEDFKKMYDDYKATDANGNSGVGTKGLYFRQTCDIDFAGKTNYWYKGFFYGLYDGAGYRILNLTINESGSSNTNVGLFSRLDNATVKNVNLVGANITGNFNGLTGGIAGSISAMSTTPSTIYACTIDSTSKISGKGYVGGIIGGLDEGSVISYCTSSAKITAAPDLTTEGSGKHAFAGGIAGRMTEASDVIKYCINNGDISVSGTSDKDSHFAAGGITGLLIGTVEKCYNSGDISCTNSGSRLVAAGGIAGRVNERTDDTENYIRNCYSDAASISASSNGGDVHKGLIIGRAIARVYIAGTCYAIKTSDVSSVVQDNSDQYVKDTTKCTVLDSASDTDANTFDTAVRGVKSEINKRKVVKFYGTQETTADKDSKFKIRFIAGLNNRNYESVGMDITLDINGGKTVKYGSFKTQVAYTSVLADGKTIKASDYGFGGFVCIAIGDIPANAELKITVETYVRNADGEKLYVDTQTVSYSNGKFVA